MPRGRPLLWEFSQPGFNPLQISGMKLWLKSDAGLWQNSARTTPATADGDPVGGWTDQSGQNDHASQGSAGAKPTLKLAIQNGLSVVRADGVNDTLTLASALNLTNCTLFLVFAPSGTITSATTFQGLMGIVGTASGALGLGNLSGSLTNEVVSFVSDVIGTIYGAVDPANLSGWHTHTFQLSGSSEAIYRDGVSQSLNTSLNGHMDSSDANKQFRAVTVLLQAFGGFLSGDLGEVLVYDTALSSTNRKSVEAYLKSRWATP